MMDVSEKLYSVVVEKEDGRTEVVAARGASPADAFREAKAMPGVRRVGKVTESGRHGHDAREAEHKRAVDRFDLRPPPPSRESLLANPVSGPRVVVHARSGGEQPFKHLKPPPDRPQNLIPKVELQPPPTSAEGVCRIVKSRRRDGQPYLVQQGSWIQTYGKRTFRVDWEKGFATREEAEAEANKVDNR